MDENGDIKVDNCRSQPQVKEMDSIEQGQATDQALLSHLSVLGSNIPTGILEF